MMLYRNVRSKAASLCLMHGFKLKKLETVAINGALPLKTAPNAIASPTYNLCGPQDTNDAVSGLTRFHSYHQTQLSCWKGMILASNFWKKTAILQHFLSAINTTIWQSLLDSRSMTTVTEG